MPKIGITLEDVLRRSKKQSKRKNYRGWVQSFGGIAPINNAFFNMAMGTASEPCCGGEADGGVGMVGSMGESIDSNGSNGGYIIDTFRSSSGRSYVEDMLSELSEQSQAEVANDLEQLRILGRNAREPLSKPVGDGIFEFRSTTCQGNVRILFFFAKGKVILLTNGMVKKRSDLPRSEIELAKRRRAIWLRDHIDRR